MPVKKAKKSNEVVNTVLDDLKNLNIDELTTHIKNNVGEASDEVINLIHDLINKQHAS
jgi:cysteinyl-tRNA synthetase